MHDEVADLGGEGHRLNALRVLGLFGVHSFDVFNLSDDFHEVLSLEDLLAVLQLSDEVSHGLLVSIDVLD